VALVMWGDLFEDFHDTIDVSLDRFRTDYSGSWLFGYVEALDRAGVRTTLFHVSARVQHTERFEHEPTGVPVVILPVPRRHRWVRWLYRRWGRKSLSSLASYLSVPLRSMRREFRQMDAEAVLTQEYEHARFDVLVALGKTSRLPVFATFQGGDTPHSRLERLIRPLTVRASAGLVIGSSQELERVRTAYRVRPDRLGYIPNAMDVDGFIPLPRDAARQQLGIPPGTRVVEWHGRITIRRKGLDVLLAAWEVICRERPGADLLLLLVGTGTDAVAFRRAIDATGLDSIRWLDEYVADRAALLPYQCAADVYVLPSRHEGFPVAPIEAMAAGVAVVAADAPGVVDLFPDGERSGGIVVAREDVEALASAVGRLVDDPQLSRELGRRGRLRAERHYSLEAVGTQLRAFMFGDRPPRPSR
jgi:glycosyltransferase involved in cell wall biosynthesis